MDLDAGGKMGQISTKRRPGRPRKDTFERLKSNIDRVVMLKTINPEIRAIEVAAKLGTSLSSAKKYLAHRETKARLAGVKARTLDQIADAYNVIVEQAVRLFPSCLVAMKEKDTDLAVRLSACRLILEPIFEGLAASGRNDADEIEFHVMVQEDGAVTQRVTRSKAASKEPQAV